MTAQTISLDLTRYPIQGRFVGTSSHEVAFVGGIGSGKTWAGCIRGLMASQGYIGNKPRIQTPNLGVITAPTYDMLKDATLRTFLDIAGPLVANYNKVDHLATMTNGSEIIFRTASDPDKLRGPSISWWFGDEAALCVGRVREIMLGRLRQFGKLGYAWLTTTPKGRNWIWQVFVQSVKSSRKIFRARSRDNVYLSPDVLEMWETSYTGDFAKQELDGEFVAFEGLIYAEFMRELHVATFDQRRIVSTVAGVDWGYVHPGVILVVGTDSDGRAYVVDEQYQRQCRIEEWVEVAKQLRATWHIGTFYCDPSEPDYIKQFRDAGLPAQAADNSVNTGIQAVKNRLVIQGDGNPRLALSPDAVWTASQFESYEWAKNQFGMRDQPVKANDDTLDALRYAVMGLDKGMKPITAKTQAWA